MFTETDSKETGIQMSDGDAASTDGTMDNKQKNIPSGMIKPRTKRIVAFYKMIGNIKTRQRLHAPLGAILFLTVAGGRVKLYLLQLFTQLKAC